MKFKSLAAKGANFLYLLIAIICLAIIFCFPWILPWFFNMLGIR